MKIPKIEGRRARNDGTSRVVAGGFLCMCCKDYYPSWSCVTKSDFKHPDNGDKICSICAYCICDFIDNGFDSRYRIMDYLKNDGEVIYYDFINKKFDRNKDNPAELNSDPEKREHLKNLFK